MKTIPSIQVHRILHKDEIYPLLKDVEYIVKATPSNNENYPVHITIFLNTQDTLPNEISRDVFKKFCKELDIEQYFGLMAELQPVAFAKTDMDTPMPMHLIQEDDMQRMEYINLFIYDFAARAKGYKEVEEGLTGWSYSYSN